MEKILQSILLFFGCTFPPLFGSSQTVQLDIPGSNNIHAYGDCVELLNPQDFVSWKWFKSYEFDGHDYYEIYFWETNLVFNCEAIYWNYAIEAVTTSNDTIFHEYTYGYDECAGLYVDIESQLIGGNTYELKAYAMGGSGGNYSFYWLHNYEETQNTTISNPELTQGYSVYVMDDVLGCSYGKSFMITECSGYIPDHTISLRPPSYGGACDGVISMHTDVNPFVRFYLSQNEGYVLPEEANQLCDGYYELIVFEHENSEYFGCKGILPVILPDPDLIVNNIDTLAAPFITDTLFTTLEENCELNYQSIDSAYIFEYTTINADTIAITWNVYDSAGLHQVIVYYPLPDEDGLFAFNLQLYCPQKSSEEYLYAYDYVSLGTSLGIEQLDVQQLFIYPNPLLSGSDFRVNSPLSGYLNVYNLLGERVIYQPVSIGENTISTSGLSAGSYVISATSSDGIVTGSLRLTVVD